MRCTASSGALLVTDWKENLHEMFELGKEVIAYRTPEECAELIRYYLEHENEREEIARAGQQRILNEHTTYQRMQELVDIVGRHIRRPVAMTQGTIA
jgi:spore maturation protein CgeB